MLTLADIETRAIALCESWVDRGLSSAEYDRLHRLVCAVARHTGYDRNELKDHYLAEARLNLRTGAAR